MNWYIGQKIICVKSHQQGVVKKGQVFEVKGIKCKHSCSCRDVRLDVGFQSLDIRGRTYKCTVCRGHLVDDGIWWLFDTRFAPIQEEEIGNTTTEAILEEIEYHELQEA